MVFIEVDMSFTIKLTSRLWTKLAYYPEGYPDGFYPCDLTLVLIANYPDAVLRTSAELKEFITEKFKGEYSRLFGWGSITFETEEDLTWFLLHL